MALVVSVLPTDGRGLAVEEVSKSLDYFIISANR